MAFPAHARQTCALLGRGSLRWVWTQGGLTLAGRARSVAGMDALLFKNRLAVMGGAFVLGLLSALLVQPDTVLLQPVWQFVEVELPPRLTLGVTGLLCLVAFTLRIAAEAELGHAVYGQGETKGLVDSGPFSRVRNPLYVATWLFFAAITALWAPWPLWLAMMLLFARALHGMVRHEETLLLASLGAPYQGYLERVGRWMPKAGVRSGATAGWKDVLHAIPGNLGFLSLGAYRVAVAAGAPVKVAGALNLVLLVVWLVVLAMRRWGK